MTVPECETYINMFDGLLCHTALCVQCTSVNVDLTETKTFSYMLINTYLVKQVITMPIHQMELKCKL